MADLKNSRWIWLKGWLFLFLGSVAATLVLLESPSLRNALYLAIAVWAFCRFYYFAFHVLQHYVDPGYRFSGLCSFARYILRKRTPCE